jgi:hypothetical protein
MLECALLDHCRAHFADVAEHIFLSMGSDNQLETWIDDGEDAAGVPDLAITPAWIQQFNSYEQNFWRCLRKAPDFAFSTQAETESGLSSQVEETDADVRAMMGDATTSTTTTEDDAVPAISTSSESALPPRRHEETSMSSPLARLASFFSSILILLGRTEDAYVVLNASLEGLRQAHVRDLFGESQLCRVLAVVLMGQRRLEEAETMLSEAFEIYTKLKSSFGLALVFSAQSHLHRLMLRFIDRSASSKVGRDEKAARLERFETRAIDLCARALELFTQIKHLPGQIASTRWLAHHGPQSQRHAYFDRLTLSLQALTKQLAKFSKNLRADQDSVEPASALKLPVSTPPSSARSTRMLSSSSSSLLLGYEADPLLGNSDPCFIGAANGAPYESVHSTYVSHWAGDDTSLHIQTVLGHVGLADGREAAYDWISAHALRLSRLRVALHKKWMPLSSSALFPSASSSSLRGTPMSASPSLASLQSPIISMRPPRAPSSTGGATPSAPAVSSTGKTLRRPLQGTSQHASIMYSPRGIISHRPLSAAQANSLSNAGALNASPASIVASMHFKHSRCVRGNISCRTAIPYISEFYFRASCLIFQNRSTKGRGAKSCSQLDSDRTIARQWRRHL